MDKADPGIVEEGDGRVEREFWNWEIGKLKNISRRLADYICKSAALLLL